MSVEVLALALRLVAVTAYCTNSPGRTGSGAAVIVTCVLPDGGEIAVSVARLLVADPAVFVTTTKYVLLLSASVVAGVVYVELFVAPVAGTLLVASPFFQA